MMKTRITPSFIGRAPASALASRTARSSSKKRDTKCELLLRRSLWAAGFRYRLFQPLPGRPDLVFLRQRVVVFCDGDFWHGRDLEMRLARLRRGHNATYWVEKIRTNVVRDRATTNRLRRQGWRVIRLWETDIFRDPSAAVSRIAKELKRRESCRLAPKSNRKSVNTNAFAKQVCAGLDSCAKR